MGTPVFPGSVKTFTTKQDGIDTVVASHVNTLQDEVVGLQTHVGVSSELPSLNLPSTSGTGAAVANRISPQINGLKQWADHLDTYKAPLLSPTFTGTVTLPSTTVIGGITNTELGYLDGVTSSIQTQLNGKVSTSGGTISGTLTVTGVVKCAQGVAADDAVNRAQYDYAATINADTYARRPRAVYPNHTYSNDTIGVVMAGSGSLGLAHYNSGNTFGWSADAGGGGGLVNNAFSSRSLKRDIRDLNQTERGLFDLIEAQSFTMRSDGSHQLGFIAEDCQAAGLPVVEVPTLGSDGAPLIALNDRVLLAVLWSTVKGQQEQIADLVAQVSDLSA